MKHLIFLLFLAFSAAGQVANVAPSADWITAPDSEGTVYFRRSFETPPRLLKSILLFASKGRGTLFLNGREVGSVEPSERAASLDVTAFLKAGKNVLAIKMESTPVFAVLLELNGDLADRRWIPSDATWLFSAESSDRWSETDFADRSWARVRSLGPVPAGESNPFNPAHVFDAYDSWRLALKGGQATPVESFTLLDGFKAELVRSAEPGEDSWIALAFDPKGRVLVARERRGILRGTRSADGKLVFQEVNDTLLECRGLLVVGDHLFASANNSKALFRLGSVHGDGPFEKVEEILRTGGGVGHGRNHPRLGPDGLIYLAHGNNVLLPEFIQPDSPLQHYAADQLIPCSWDDRMFDGDVELPAGHILRFNPEELPARPELVAGGMRNPLDVAFNADGEMFTFDADMEWDVGAPWYMPNRILHLVSGADFGWRRGTGRFPAYYADTLPSVTDIGLASPTSVIFGHGSRFPERYQKALYALDWAYGRILAVHLREAGGSYKGDWEVFASGRPLNVTDACIGPDGALWFVTGGRQTQSGLYRIFYREPLGKQPAGIERKKREPRPRRIRKQLEMFHAKIPAEQQPRAIRTLWPSLGDQDRFVRHAARVALEHLPVSAWRGSALEEKNPRRALTALLALVRVADPQDRGAILGCLQKWNEKEMPEELRLELIRAWQIFLSRHGRPSEAEAWRIYASLERLYPCPDKRLNRELCKMLVYFKAPSLLSKTIPLLKSSSSSEDLLFYLFHLRQVDSEWTPAFRREFFEALARAESMPGGRQYVKALSDIRREVTGQLTVAEKEMLGPYLQSLTSVAAADIPSRPVVKDWRMEDLAPHLKHTSSGRSFAGAKGALVAAQCVACHRVTPDNSLPGSALGPDLVSVGLRFSGRDLLDHILHPSKVVDEKFRLTTVLMKDGSEFTGMVEAEDEGLVVIRPPLGNPEHLRRDEIEKIDTSVLSPMPEGLINILSLEEVLDLVAFLEAGGDPKAPAFRRN